MSSTEPPKAIHLAHQKRHQEKTQQLTPDFQSYLEGDEPGSDKYAGHAKFLLDDDDNDYNNVNNETDDELPAPHIVRAKAQHRKKGVITNCNPNMELFKRCVQVTNHDPAVYEDHTRKKLIRPQRAELCQHFIDDYHRCVQLWVDQRSALTGFDPRYLPRRDATWFEQAKNNLQTMTDLMYADIPEDYETFEHNRTWFEETPEQKAMKEQMRNMWRYIEDPKEREKWKANWFLQYDKYREFDDRWNNQVRYRGEEKIDAKLKKPLSMTDEEWDEDIQKRGHPLWDYPRKGSLDPNYMSGENKWKIKHRTNMVDPYLRPIAFGYLLQKSREHEAQYPDADLDYVEKLTKHLGISFEDEEQWR